MVKPSRQLLAYRIVIAVIAATASLASAADVPPVMLSVAPLAKQIKEAIGSGAAEVVLPPGVYRSDVEVGCKAHLSIRNAKGLRIVADGVTLICGRRTRAIEINDCEGLTIEGLAIDYDPLPFTQGRIIALADDDKAVDVQLDAGYPRELFSRIDIVDRNTRTRKRGMPFLWNAKSEWLDAAAAIVRVHQPGLKTIAEIGDLVSLSTGQEADGSPHGITISQSLDTTLRNVTVYSAPGMGIIETDGEGAAKFLGCRIIPGPKPASATQERLLSSSWDAIQNSTVRRGPLIENCVIQNAGDDSWSMQSADYVILAADGRTMTIAQRHRYTDGPLVGDRLSKGIDAPTAVIIGRRAISLSDAKVDASIIEKLKKAKSYDYWDLSDRYIQLTLDSDAPFAVGDSVYDPDRQGAGFIFRNNFIHSPGRGALIEGGRGTIENNTFSEVHCAVMIARDDSTSVVRGIMIRGNRISGSGYLCPAPWSHQVGAVSIGCGDGIVVENNSFDDVNGINVAIMGASNVSVRNNSFSRTFTTQPNDTGANFKINQHALIWIDQSRQVLLEANRVQKQGPFAQTLVGLGNNVQALQGKENGVVLAAEK